MPIHTSAIRAFLAKWETSQTVGYIPCRKRNFTGRTGRTGRNSFIDCGDVIASSGVTIGTGVDLGQQTHAGLLSMGVPAVLVIRFEPYIGKSRLDAVEALTQTPLEITSLEREALDRAVHADYIRRAAEKYNREAVTPFADIPAEAQAVIVSLFYQLGSPHGNPGYRKTWVPLTAGDWAGAALELKTGFTRYANRRADEGALLATLLEVE